MFQTEANSMGVAVRPLYVRGPGCKASLKKLQKTLLPSRSRVQSEQRGNHRGVSHDSSTEVLLRDCVEHLSGGGKVSTGVVVFW